MNARPVAMQGGPLHVSSPGLPCVRQLSLAHRTGSSSGGGNQAAPTCSGAHSDGRDRFDPERIEITYRCATVAKISVRGIRVANAA